jgi:uncharacterized membrane protein YdfJ with MMPL/SSD domain
MRTRIIQDNPEPPEPHTEQEAPHSAKRSHNLAARMERWSAKHRRTAIVGWIVFVVLAYMVGGKVGTDTLGQSESGVGDSGAAAKLIDERYPDENGELVIVQSETLRTDAPEFQAAVDDVMKGLDGKQGVTNVESPYENPTTGISDDGRSALVSFEIKGDAEATKTKDTADATVAATERVQEAHSELVVEQFGSVSSEQAFEEVFEKDLQKAAIGSLPIVIILFTLTFGTLVAAGIPLLLGITAWSRRSALSAR